MRVRFDRRETGFTLLELLVVVIIVGILASVALPQFTKATRKARASEAVATVGAYLTAELAYYQEHSFFENADDNNLLITKPTGGKFNYALSGTTSKPVVSADGNSTEVTNIKVTGSIDATGVKTITITGI